MKGATMSADKTPRKQDPLDEALKQTFPASDAIAIITPHRPQRHKQTTNDDDVDKAGRKQGKARGRSHRDLP
jgi:hypothetical protein